MRKDASCHGASWERRFLGLASAYAQEGKNPYLFGCRYQALLLLLPLLPVGAGAAAVAGAGAAA